MKIFVRGIFPVFFFFILALHSTAQKLAVVEYVSGLDAPIDIKNCGDNRLFVAERAGRIRVINADGTLRPTPFLNITSKISSTDGEEGLLGIVFSPDYKTSRKFYVDYTSNISGQLTSVIEEYKVNAADSNVADLSSALVILTQSQPANNHNGGNLMFGKDGFLYINFGDGGGEGDPDGNGQNKNTFLGKILRIDVSNSSTTTHYITPPSNPFFNDVTPGIKKEIWAYGVRNPWRCSVDRLNGDLWIADVGQDLHEELDYQPANTAGGRNYGWSIMEANACYNPSTGCNMAGITLPLYDYPHTYGNSITGGYMYRSAQSKSLFGTYIFGDFGAKWIDGIKQVNGVLSGSVTHFITAAQATGNPISFGEDMLGDQYVLFYDNGSVYQLLDTSYLRRPKAYITPADQGGGTFLLQGLQGKNLTYQWLNNNVPIPGATSADYTTAAAGSYTLVVTNALDISDTSDVFSLGALPLNLISFTAQKISADRIRLGWETASEQNISGYTILRRQNNEAIFSNIGSVRSQSLNGFSNSKLEYTFIDSSAIRSNAKIFYRLRIQNSDGSYTFSDIRSITTGGSTKAFTLYPNPAKGQVQVYFDNFTHPEIMSIYDNTGKKVKEQFLNQQATTIELSVPKGVYIIQMSDKNGDNAIRQKLMVQ